MKMIGDAGQEFEVPDAAGLMWQRPDMTHTNIDIGKPSQTPWADYSPVRIYKSNFDKVCEFHRAFNIAVGDDPKMPDRSTNRLRMNLIFEELIELIEAKASGDLGHTTKEIA